MYHHHNQVHTRAPGNAFLYALVFKSAFSTCLIVFLLISFTLQPFHRAYAAEDVVSETDAAVASTTNSDASDSTESAEPEVEVSETEETAEVDTAPETDAVDQAQTENSSPATDSEETSSTTDAADTTTNEPDSNATNDTETEVATSAPAVAETAENVSSTTDAPTLATATATTSSDNAASATTTASSTSPDDASEPETDRSTTTQSDPPEQATSRDDAKEASNETVTSSTSADAEPAITKEMRAMVSDENFYQFSKDSCVLVGNGSYHCSDTDAAVTDAQSVVYSDTGESGTQEIFIQTARGNVEQITDNGFDDTAPHYDPESLRIAWQRQIDGRTQIILYDLRSEEETQLTFARQNSMEPAVSAAGVTWQMWDGSDWEIYFYDGTYNEQLTDNETQDVSPVLEDTYIIWTVIGKKAQYAQVYDIASSEITTIENHEGGSIVNPRFVLVYDTQYENGDVITQGFDPKTGFSKPITSQPAPEPIDIPPADSTGEIKALIQNKSSKDEFDSPVPEPEPEPDLITSGEGATSTASTTPALDLSTTTLDATDDGVAVTATTTDTTLELTEYDLVITPEGESSTSTTEIPAEEVVATTTQATD